MAALTFTLRDANSAPRFIPRLGALSFKRHDGSAVPEILTPGLITKTSRGIVPHLSRDHIELTPPIRWTQVHLETFLERVPPVPTLQNGSHPLHTFLGFQPQKHLLALTVRDPHDGQELPPNGKDFVSCRCVRGVRQMTPAAWRSYVFACRSDVVTALADTPLAPFPHSQKRTTKSLERSIAWLADLLRPPEPLEGLSEGPPLTVLVCMAGGSDSRARSAFAEGLVETLYGKDQELVHPLRNLDEGVSGYVFDLAPLRAQLQAEDLVHEIRPKDVEHRSADNNITNLLKVSLAPLSLLKPRIAHSPRSPHEMLQLIEEVGVDLLDAPWAHQAADIGIALDFTFPVRDIPLDQQGVQCIAPRRRAHGKTDLGHNLFHTAYAHDHSRLSSYFLDAWSSHVQESNIPTCSCAACSPYTSQTHIQHSSVDAAPNTSAIPQRPFLRSYIHHLLHTHEMSSHSLLAMHNLTIVDAFFTGIRKVLGESDGLDRFRDHVSQFCATYDDGMALFDEAKTDWAAVDRARGKGRLQRQTSDSVAQNK